MAADGLKDIVASSITNFYWTNSRNNVIDLPETLFVLLRVQPDKAPRTVDVCGRYVRLRGVMGLSELVLSDIPFVHMIGAWVAAFGVVVAVFLFALWIESRFDRESDDDPREWYGI